MEELTESARQCLVSQGMILGALTVLNSLCLFVTGIVVVTRATYILHFTSLTHLAILEIICGVLSFTSVIYIWWITAAYRYRELEIRSKCLDEHMSRALLTAFFPLILTFAALVVSTVFLMLKVESNSSYELKVAMTLYSTDMTRKVIVDKLQIMLGCCGSLSLLDWFLVDWQNIEMVPGFHFQNKTISDWDSVPFSCCCQEVPPPCIHHQLRTFGVGSLYTAGCADKLDTLAFYFVLTALIMFLILTFLTMILLYMCRKLQTSARSAIMKGDATAPGEWWLLSAHKISVNDCQAEDFVPLLGKKEKKNFMKGARVAAHYVDQDKYSSSPFLPEKKQNKTESNARESASPENSITNQYIEFSEDWTRMANNPSESTSSTSLLTSTRLSSSTSETRHSVSDTAVANLEVSHHFEHKVRPLYRT